MNGGPQGWVCCQIGTREHYAIPRALHRERKLDRLITDAWLEPAHPLARIAPARLRQRYHPELNGAPVVVAGLSGAVLEPWSAWIDPRGWRWRLWRNRWFQQQAVRALTALQRREPRPRLLFAYSYAALELFRFARAHGWTTVLGQMDPGVAEERIVAALHAQRPDLAAQWQPAPAAHWQAWREECTLADHIVVNSEWSAVALRGEGVDAGKIHIVPLAYSGPPASRLFTRQYPDTFTSERPMRVLFFGQVNLRKGMAEIIDAFGSMPDRHITLDVVGPRQVNVPRHTLEDDRIRFHGAVAHDAAAAFFQRADVFLFPTHSDGFGLTQLEARAWGLPLIVSRACGEVVRDGVDGVQLDAVTAPALVSALRALAAAPGTLAAMSRAIASAPVVGTDTLAAHLQQIEDRAPARHR